MKRCFTPALWLLCAAGLALPAHAQWAKTEARLLLSHQSAPAGSEILAGVELQMPPKWHTYWRNPGGSGSATKIQWDVPSWITPGEILWPTPARYTALDITTYVYHNRTILLVPLKIAQNAPAGPADVRAKVDWLECDETCILGSASIQAQLTIGGESQPSPHAEKLAAARQALPQNAQSLRPMAGWEGPPAGDERSLIIEWTPAQPGSEPDFFPDRYSDFEVSVDSTILTRDDGRARIRKKVTQFEGAWPQRIRGLLVEKSAAGKTTAYEVDLPVSDASAPPAVASAGASAAPKTTAQPGSPSLVKMLWFGFIGGMILNIMPCVFPVIALKILGFVNQSKQAPGKVFELGLLYTTGVIASFLVMAGLVIAVRSAGGAASWGMQMQNPQFTVGLTTLIALVALNLFGVFEINLGGGAMGAAGNLASKEGRTGAFFNGILATALATPCTAPFLAPALGFAFAQPAGVILAMFISVALGLALPYLVLSAKPDWLRFLPRPGPWMQRFKVAMGFPMLATAVWLFSFTAPRFGSDGVLYLGLFLVMIGLAAWVWGEFVQRGSRRRGWAMAVAAFFALGGYVYALEGELHWRTPAGKSTAQPSAKSAANGIAWSPWSAAAVTQARQEGRPVLVDFTADWCLTCKANKRTSIEIEAVRNKLRELNAVTLIGDYTDEDPLITAELNRFERAGVPLVLVYPKNPAAAPIVLPALLTPGIVLDALEQAAH